MSQHRFTSRTCESVCETKIVDVISFLFGAECQSEWIPSNDVPDVLTAAQWKQIDDAIPGVPTDIIIQTVAKSHACDVPGARLVQSRAGTFGISPANLFLLETYHLETLVYERFDRLVTRVAIAAPSPSITAQGRVRTWLKETGINLESAVIETLMLEAFCAIKTPFIVSMRAAKDTTRYACYRDFDKVCPQAEFIQEIGMLMLRTPPQFITPEFNNTLPQIAAGLAIVLNFVDTHTDFKTSVTNLSNVDNWCPPNSIFWHETLGIYMRAGDTIYRIPSSCIIETVYAFIVTISTIHANSVLKSTAYEFITDTPNPDLLDY